MVRAPASGGAGLPDLRRRGAVTELLFLFECVTREPTQLRPIAEELGLTVQAASHSYRQLAARGLAELRDGHYRATVAGVAWLQAALGMLREDLVGRLERLNIVRSTHAIAAAPIAAGVPVSLQLDDGLLRARPGAVGPSRGRARAAARSGELVEVDELEGIVPILPGKVTILPVRSDAGADRRALAALRRAVRAGGGGLLGAQGLEAYHLLRRATPRPIVRFAVAAAAREASQVGVPTLVVVTDSELARLLSQFGRSAPPPLEVAARI
jgi:predicted transcriptional regulator